MHVTASAFPKVDVQPGESLKCGLGGVAEWGTVG